MVLNRMVTQKPCASVNKTRFLFYNVIFVTAVDLQIMVLNRMVTQKPCARVKETNFFPQIMSKL